MFPSEFKLEVFELPPEPDKPGEGLIVAIPSDSPTTTTDADILGGVLGFGVLYFPEDGGSDPNSEVNVAAEIYNIEVICHLRRSPHLATVRFHGASNRWTGRMSR